MNSKLKKCLPFIIVVALELISLIFYNEEHSFLRMKCIGILAMGGFKFAIPMLIFNAAFVFVYLLAYNYVVILVTDTQFMAKKVFKNIGILFAVRTGFDILYYLLNASVTCLSETYIDFSYLINSTSPPSFCKYGLTLFKTFSIFSSTVISITQNKYNCFFSIFQGKTFAF